MKSLKLSLVMAFFIFFSCHRQQSNNSLISASSDKIEAYYFHFTARCVTCRTVESNAKANIENLYPAQVKKGLITFQSLNLEEDSARSLADRLGVAGQTLLLVKGNNKIDLTQEGFMYAVSQPEKFKSIISEKIDGMLIQQ